MPQEGGRAEGDVTTAVPPAARRTGCWQWEPQLCTALPLPEEQILPRQVLALPQGPCGHFGAL